MTESGLFANEARNLGKSARTRARLMDAAVGVFARDGFEAASVNEIARAAEVANGTFYVHFKDRDDIAGAVAIRIAGDVARQLDEAMVDIDDAVERTSCATRRFIDLASSRSDWGMALFRAAWFFPGVRAGVVDYLRDDLERGVRQGAFTVEVDDFLVGVFAAMTLTALFRRLQGEAGEEAGSKVAELQLRMLGVAPEQAKQAAWRTIEPLKLDVRPLVKGSTPS